MELALAKAMIKRFEGCILTPYLCPAGVPSIGYGSTRYEDGSSVSLSDGAISKDRAEAMLDRDLAVNRVPLLFSACQAPLNDGQAAALLDFIYNLGGGAFRASTLRRRINSGDYATATTEFYKWVYCAGKRSRGLLTRRDAEARLFGA